MLIYYFYPKNVAPTTTIETTAQPEAHTVTQTDPQPHDDHESADITHSKNLDLVGNNFDYLLPEQRFTEVFARRPNAKFTEQQLRESMKKEVPWTTQGVDAQKIIKENELTDEEIHDGRVFIKYDPLKVESLVSGDTMKLDIPQDKTYTMKVSRVEVNDPKTVTWYGTLLNTSGTTSVTITQSDRISQIGIFTPDGFYVAEIFDNEGWIVPGGRLFKNEEMAEGHDEHGHHHEHEHEHEHDHFH